MFVVCGVIDNIIQFIMSMSNVAQQGTSGGGMYRLATLMYLLVWIHLQFCIACVDGYV